MPACREALASLGNQGHHITHQMWCSTFDAGDPPVRFGGRGEVKTLVPTPIGGCREKRDGLLQRTKASGITGMLMYKKRYS
jgi:hypothetical protein